MKGKNFYNSGDDVIKILNQDCTGRNLMRKTANANDAESVREAFNSIIQKYGLKLKVIEAENTEALDFLKADEEFHW